MNNEEHKKPFQKIDFKKKPHVMVIEARFYEDIGDMQAEGALEVLAAQGATFERFTVPGALEIPAAVVMGEKSGKFDAYVALGCVIRGATTHYEIVAGESSRALMDLSVAGGLCIGNGILTVENMDQALERADKARLNKGGGAAQAALEMVAIRERLKAAA